MELTAVKIFRPICENGSVKFLRNVGSKSYGVTFGRTTVDILCCNWTAAGEIYDCDRQESTPTTYWVVFGKRKCAV